MSRKTNYSWPRMAFDQAIALLALPIAAVIIVLGSAAVFLAFGRPIFFKQERIGYRGTRFVPYKLRTMNDAQDPNGCLLPDSKRRKPVGNFLRAYGIDEVPQIINVIKGEMSIIGPRPMPFDEIDPQYFEIRQSIKPGITGLMQVSNPPNAELSLSDRMALDIHYVEKHNAKLDAQILWKTVVKVVTGCNDHSLSNNRSPHYPDRRTSEAVQDSNPLNL